MDQQAARELILAVLDNSKKLEAVIGLLSDIRDSLVEAPVRGERILVQGQDRSILETLIAAGLHSAPRQTRPVNVTTKETMLVENQSEAFLVVKITNDDIAKELWVGEAGVTIENGSVILPQYSDWYTLAPAQKLYGVCSFATLSARVSLGYDLMMQMRRNFQR